VCRPKPGWNGTKQSYIVEKTEALREILLASHSSVFPIVGFHAARPYRAHDCEGSVRWSAYLTLCSEHRFWLSIPSAGKVHAPCASSHDRRFFSTAISIRYIVYSVRRLDRLMEILGDVRLPPAHLGQPRLRACDTASRRSESTPSCCRSRRRKYEHITALTSF